MSGSRVIAPYSALGSGEALRSGFARLRIRSLIVGAAFERDVSAARRGACRLCHVMAPRMRKYYEILI